MKKLIAKVFLPLIAVAGCVFLPVAHSQETQEPEANYNPLADPHAVILAGHARFTVLTPQLIRMEWAADGKFEDHASLVFLNRRLPVPAFTDTKDGEKLTLRTSHLTLTYNPVSADDGKFSADNLTITLQVEGKAVTWHPGLADTGNLEGTTRTLDGALGDKTREPLGAGLVSRDGWALVDDSHRPLFDSDNFTFAAGENSDWPWVMERPAGDRQDFYFFAYGHDYKAALHDYVTVAGRIPLPPRFALGAWWSRYWAYSDQELAQLVHDFHENDVPLDVLVIDMDWHLNGAQLRAKQETDQSGHELGWSGYTWNALLFPDPTAFLHNIHEDGLKVTLNLHPASGVEPWEASYPAMAKAMGIDPATHKYVPFDITDKTFATNYMNILHHPLEKQGVNFWWLDWQQEADTRIPGVNPTWWLNYVHFTDQQKEGKRPLLFHRWGGLGNHRYQIGFSGDTFSAWSSLAYQPWFTATAANVGYAYWSHDIGGHQPGPVDAELYTRWVQFGAFSPILRTHTTKNPGAERRIWAYPEPYADIMRNTFQLRYALQPYLYTEARRTYDTGVAFFRPLYYDWPEQDAAYNTRNEYVFGSDLLVAPVTAPLNTDTQLASESVWIPAGQWVERDSGKTLSGPRTIERSFSIDQIPVYVKAGAILPMQPPMRYTGEKPVDPLIVNVYPLGDGQSSTYRLYEDKGDSEAYKRGICAWTSLSAHEHGDVLTVEIAPVDGDYPGMVTTRAYEIRLPGDWPPASVTSNGRALAWHYDGSALSTIITVPRASVHTKVEIEVRRAAGSLTRRPQLDGFAGRIIRLRAAYNEMNSLWNHAGPSPALIEALQTGDRLTYYPETAAAELKRFPDTYRQAVADVNNLLGKANLPDAALAKQLELDGDPAALVYARHYKTVLGHASAMLNSTW